MNLFADLLDIRVQDLPLVERLCGKHVFIYGTPENKHKWPVSALKNPNSASDESAISTAVKGKPNCDSHAHFVPADDKGDLATPRVDKAAPAAVHGDVLAVSRRETDGGVVKRLACVLQNCRREGRRGKKANLRTRQNQTAQLKICVELAVKTCGGSESRMLLLLRCIASINGRSFGCRLHNTGVPIRSWGRNPSRGTALMCKKSRLLGHITFHDSEKPN